MKQNKTATKKPVYDYDAYYVQYYFNNYQVDDFYDKCPHSLTPQEFLQQHIVKLASKMHFPLGELKTAERESIRQYQIETTIDRGGFGKYRFGVQISYAVEG